MARVWLLAFALLYGISAAGCASKPHVTEQRHAPTGIAEEERIAIVLSSYSKEGIDLASREHADERAREWDRLERWLESCVRAEMLAVRSNLVFLSSSELRQRIFPGASRKELPRDHDELLELLARSDLAGRDVAPRLRYVIMLAGRYDTSPGRFTAGAEHQAAYIGREWNRSSHLSATVLDVLHRRVAGEIAASSSGPAGAALGIVWIIPVPIFYGAAPESTACTALGETLGRFLIE